MEIGSKVIVYAKDYKVEGIYGGEVDNFVIVYVDPEKYAGTVYLNVIGDYYIIPKNEIIKIVEKD